MSYTFKKSAFAATQTFLLRESEILMTSDNGKTKSIPYYAIKKVSLFHIEPTNNQNNSKNKSTLSENTGIPKTQTMSGSYGNVIETYQCKLSINGQKPVVISNNHFVSFAKFLPQNKEYTTFIKKLHQKLATNKNIVFQKGTDMGAFLGITVLFTILSLVLLVIAIVLFINQKHLIASALLIGEFLLIFAGLKLYKSYQPKVYNPKKIPEELLP